MKFHGAFVAVITPFDRKGRVDRKNLGKLIEWHIQEGTQGIVCCGATGEGVALDSAEKKRVVSICVEASEGKIPIIAGCGTSSTKQSVQLTEQMQRLGANGCLIVTPYYNRPSQRGCILHFQEIAKVGLPVIAYHNPGRTAVRFTPETVAEIGKIPGVAALKDSSCDLEFIRKVRKVSSIPILSGDDDLSFETIREGGVGAISVVGNLFPRAWRSMIDGALQGKWEMAKAIADRYAPLCKALFLEANPQPLKFAMEWLGLNNGFLRLPLVSIAEETENEIKRVLVALSLPQMERIKIQQ